MIKSDLKKSNLTCIGKRLFYSSVGLFYFNQIILKFIQLTSASVTTVIIKSFKCHLVVVVIPLHTLVNYNYKGIIIVTPNYITKELNTTAYLIRYFL